MVLDRDGLLAYGLNAAEAEEILSSHRETLEREINEWRAEHAVPPFEPWLGGAAEPQLAETELKHLSCDQINSGWETVKRILAGRKQK